MPSHAYMLDKLADWRASGTGPNHPVDWNWVAMLYKFSQMGLATGKLRIDENEAEQYGRYFGWVINRKREELKEKEEEEQAKKKKKEVK